MDEVSASAPTEVNAPLQDRLELWFSCFLDGSPRWGLVDYWRDDGTCYKRHGIIATLNVDLWKRLQEDQEQLMRMREAIDLAQLVVAVEPSVIVSLLQKNREYDLSTKPDYSDELDAIKRGVPVALELRFEVGGSVLPRLKDRFNENTIKSLDWTLSSDEAFLTVREELMDRVKRDKSKLTQVMHTTVHAIVAVKQWYSDDATPDTSEEWFENLRAFAEDLSSYQRDRMARTPAAEDAIDTRHVHFQVDKINLELGRWCITPRVVNAATRFVDFAGFPVNCSLLHLDFRLMDCDETTLRSFLRTMTRGDVKLRIDTIAMSLNEVIQGKIYSADGDGEDYCERIGMILRAIASVSDRVRELALDGLLALCDTNRKREAVWRGLVEDILSRDEKVGSIAFEDSTVLRNDDATVIEARVAEWRAAHPDRKISVKRLRLRVKQPDATAISALLAVFDDVEEISLELSSHEWPLHREVVHNMLAFSSLRKLHVSNACVTTMDLFDPAVPDDRFPVKPVLEELLLKDIVLDDVPSLGRFFQSLNPLLSTSPLTSSLQVLHVTERRSQALNPVHFYSGSMLDTLTDMLEVNSVLRDVMVTDVGDKSLVGHWTRVFSRGCRYLPAPVGLATTDLTKSCKTAFLSTISANSSDTSNARSRIDPSVVRLIFELTEVVVSRTVHKHTVP